MEYMVILFMICILMLSKEVTARCGTVTKTIFF